MTDTALAAAIAASLASSWWEGPVVITIDDDDEPAKPDQVMSGIVVFLFLFIKFIKFLS